MLSQRGTLYPRKHKTFDKSWFNIEPIEHIYMNHKIAFQYNIKYYHVA